MQSDESVAHYAISTICVEPKSQRRFRFDLMDNDLAPRGDSEKSALADVPDTHRCARFNFKGLDDGFDFKGLADQGLVGAFARRHEPNDLRSRRTAASCCCIRSPDPKVGAYQSVDREIHLPGRLYSGAIERGAAFAVEVDLDDRCAVHIGLAELELGIETTAIPPRPRHIWRPPASVPNGSVCPAPDKSRVLPYTRPALECAKSRFGCRCGK
jgi:hypothetical protein